MANGSEVEHVLRYRVALALTLLLVAFVLTATIVEASVLRGLTVKQLRQKADAIVAGEVISVRSEARDGRIETVARVRVERSWRGTDQRVVTVRMLGGLYKGKRLVVPGAASMSRGEDVLLFLYRSDGQWRPVGMFQGVWHLLGDNGARARASDSGGVGLLRPNAGEPAVDRSERTVRQLAGSAGGGR